MKEDKMGWRIARTGEMRNAYISVRPPERD
jgi:hypothetical protein